MKKIRSLAVVLACILVFCAMPFSASAEDTVNFIPGFANGKIYGIPAETPVEVIERIYFDQEVTVYDADGEKMSSSDLIATGCTVVINKASYSAVVFGDVDGNAVITSLDYLAVKRAYFGTLNLNGLKKEAAGATVTGSIRAVHYVMIKRAYFDTYDINNKYTCDPYIPDAGESGWTPGWV